MRLHQNDDRGAKAMFGIQRDEPMTEDCGSVDTKVRRGSWFTAQGH